MCKWIVRFAHMTHLAEALRCYSIINQLEQKALAEQLGMSASALSRFQKGETTPDGPTLARIFGWLMEEEVAP